MHPTFGAMHMQNVAPKLSATPGRINRPGPELGEHNAEVFAGLLGLSSARIAELAAAGIIGKTESAAA